MFTQMGTVGVITIAHSKQPECKPASSPSHIATPYPSCPSSGCVWDDRYEDQRCLLLISLEQKEHELRPVCFCLRRHFLKSHVSGLDCAFYLGWWFIDLRGVRSGHITTLLCPVTQVCDPTAYVPYFASAGSLCILVQQLSLCFLHIVPSAQSACPESFCKFTVLNSLKSIPQTHSFHNTLITLAK